MSKSSEYPIKTVIHDDDLLDISNTEDNGVTYNESQKATFLEVKTEIVHLIEDEGNPLPNQSSLNFVGGGVSVADNGGKTEVTIDGLGGTTSHVFSIADVTQSTGSFAPILTFDVTARWVTNGRIVQVNYDGNCTFTKGIAGGGRIRLNADGVLPLSKQTGVGSSLFGNPHLIHYATVEDPSGGFLRNAGEIGFGNQGIGDFQVYFQLNDNITIDTKGFSFRANQTYITLT